MFNLPSFKKSLFFTFLLFIGLNASAQVKSDVPAGWSKPMPEENAKAVKKRKLIVGLMGVKSFDEKFEEVVRSFWTLNEEIIFCEKEKIATKIQDNATDYVVLEPDIIEVITFGIKIQIGANSEPITEFIRMSFYLAEKGKLKDRDGFYQDLISTNDIGMSNPNLNTTRKRELIFAINMIQNHIIARTEAKLRHTPMQELYENPGVLEQRTLLISKDFTYLSEEQIRKIYPYKFKISTTEAVEEAQMARDANYAYVELFPFAPNLNHIHLIIDCKNGQVLSANSVYAVANSGQFIGKKHIKAYVSQYESAKKKQRKSK